MGPGPPVDDPCAIVSPGGFIVVVPNEEGRQLMLLTYIMFVVNCENLHFSHIKCVFSKQSEAVCLLCVQDFVNLKQINPDDINQCI